MYQALYRKYRPMRFSDVVGQEHITNTLRRQVAAGKTSHAYLFVGSRGTGKTTSAKILSRALNCENPQDGEPCNQCAACRGILSGAVLDVVEIDAASNNGVDNVRQIRDEAVYSPASVKKRVYIIDEVHMLSGSAFNALLKILEEPPEHLVFILATTELQKIPATILSRCQRYSFRRLGTEDIASRLRYVAREEGIDITEEAVKLLARLGDGALRDALSLLDQCLTGGTVTEERVISAVGLAGGEKTAALWESVRAGDAAEAIRCFESLYLGGTAPSSALGELLSLVRDMMMVRVAPRGADALVTGAFSLERLNALAQGADTARLMRASRELQDALSELSRLRDDRTAAEIAVIRLAGLFSGQTDTPAPEPLPALDRAPARTAPAAPSRPAPQKAAEAAPPPWEESPVTQKAAPAVQDAAPPPWEETPPPIQDDGPPPPWTQEPPPEPDDAGNAAPSAPAAPAPQPVQAPAPDAGGDWWPQVLADVRETVGMAHLFLTNPANVRAKEAGNTVTLYAQSDFIRNMIDNEPIKRAVADAASARLGRRVIVSVVTGEPPAELKKDKLEELARFKNIQFT